MRWLMTVVVVLLAPTSLTHAKATRWWRAAPGHRVIDGALNPRNGSIAYIRYGQKRLAPDGEWGFDLVVGVAEGEAARDLFTHRARFERRHGSASGSSASTWSWELRYLLVNWLPSGRHLIASNKGIHDPLFGYLVGSDERLWTKVGSDETGRWYVMNDEIPLPHDDELMLRYWLYRWPSVCDKMDRWRPEGDYGCIPSGTNPSPDGRRRIFTTSDAESVDEQGFRLWVQRPDGSGKRLLREGVSSRPQWLDTRWVTYDTWYTGSATSGTQIGIVDVHTGRGQLLTKGPYHHTLCDYKDGQFLIAEEPVGEGDERSPSYTSRLYVIEPLRVRM